MEDELFLPEALLNLRGRLPLLSQPTPSVLDGVARVHEFVTVTMRSKEQWLDRVDRLETRRLRFAAWAAVCAALVHNFDDPTAEL